MSVSLQFQNLRIEGASRAGDASWFRVHPPGLAFDVGRGALALAGADPIFLTHGHLDHALGLPFVLSLRSMQGAQPTRVFCPAATLESLRQFIEAAENIEQGGYAYELAALEPGDQVKVGRDLAVEAFATDHSVPSLGFHLVRDRRQLRVEYRDLPALELAKLRRRGTEIEDRTQELWVTYCGDTGVGVFDLEPRLFESKVLLLECTFLDEASRGRDREFKHLHLSDIADRATQFRNEDLVLHHVSWRYEKIEAQSMIEQRLAGLAPRLHLMLA
jgi:ribonuclease Z